MKSTKMSKIFFAFIYLISFFFISAGSTQASAKTDNQKRILIEQIKYLKTQIDIKIKNNNKKNNSSDRTANSKNKAGSKCLLSSTKIKYFRESYPEDMEFSGGSLTKIADVKKAFLKARKKDKTIVSNVFPLISQGEWEILSFEEKALFLVNAERIARGLIPFEGLSKEVTSVASKYGKYLMDNQYFGHTRSSDGASPWTRLNENNTIKKSQDWYEYGENLYANSELTNNEIAVEAVYTWIYNDSNSRWGHRDFIFSKLKNNSGDQNSEGLLGFGIGSGYFEYFDDNAKIFVMNGIDPSSKWNSPVSKVLLFKQCN